MRTRCLIFFGRNQTIDSSVIDGPAQQFALTINLTLSIANRQIAIRKRFCVEPVGDKMPPFEPQQQVPLDDGWRDSMIPRIGKANRSLSFYNGILYGLANSDVFISPLATREAVLSSRIVNVCKSSDII
jgi:hypothetical protein